MNTLNTPSRGENAPSSTWLGKVMKNVKGIAQWTSTLIVGTIAPTEAIAPVAHAPTAQVRPAEKAHNDDHKNGNGKLSEGVREKHKENVQAAKELKVKTVQSYFDALQKEDPLLIAEELVPEIIICCMDGRHGAGKNFPVAGVGVLLRNEQLEVMARNTVDLAKRKYLRLKQPIIIRVRPHLEGQCGAAALARKLRGEKDMSAKAVDDEAMAGAERTAKRIRELAGGAVPVKVIVEPFDRRNFYDDPNHPELGMLVNGTDMVINGDRKKGPMLFNVSTKLAGEQVATDDAVLSGVIALVLHHGMHESIQGLPKGTPYRIIFAGTKEDTDRLKRKTEATLRAHKDLGQFYMKKEIIVETWVQGKKSKQSMRQSLKDRKELTQSWLDPVNTHIEQTRKVIAQQPGFSGKKPWTRGQRNAA